MAELERLAAANHTGLLAAIERDGAVIALDFLPAATITQLREDFERAMAGMVWGHNDEARPEAFSGFTTKRFHGLLKYSDAVIDVLSDVRLLDLARARLGDRVIVSTGELMAIGPGEVKQRFHRDGDSWQRAPVTGDLLFSANVALTDFHRDNGATVVVVGSQRWETLREPHSAELAYAEMPAGSALLYGGRIVHSGGANNTAEPRIGLYFGYIPCWLRPIENFAVSVGTQRLATLEPATANLLCYRKNGFHVVL
jgi:ectoine hydroxylase-related dioxygenase (phytanoyl-CoA dioxygenase family)